jgi:dTDP-4-amino-4,6-dideoxygalactose transaminase
MAAVGAMMPGWLWHGDLPPVGNPIALKRGEYPALPFDNYTAHWVQSGTAALALALLIARERQNHIASPTVILPAYGCPDLIAAAEYAGVRPLLVDIAADDPGYDLAQLAQAIDATTIAVVAVNFLGIRERLPELRNIIAQHPHILLIEDNAQWFPEPARDCALQGDLVCLSFGRGKPVSLLGGGLLLARSGFDAPVSIRPCAPENDFALQCKTQLFGLLSRRRWYALANRNPLLELGATRFKPLTEIRALDARRLHALPAAMTNYLKLSRAIESVWRGAIARTDKIHALAVESDRPARLLRYPVLAHDENSRNRLWAQLDCAGLGVTAMYRNALPEVNGVAGKFGVYGDYANARRFAARLLTLPVHAQVRKQDVERALAIIESR